MMTEKLESLTAAVAAAAAALDNSPQLTIDVR